MSNDTKYYDITIRGVGNLYRPRIVKPKEGNNNEYKAIDINMLNGHEDNVKYVRFSTKIVGNHAKEVLTRHWDRLVKADRDGQEILAQAVITDPRPASYQTKQGEVRHYIQGRLVWLSFIRIDGEEIYKAPPREANGASSQTSSTNEDTSEETLPATVKLSKEDPNFEQRKTELKKQGYRWDNKQVAWVLRTAAQTA